MIILEPRWKNFHSTIVSIFRLSSAVSILTFIIVIPIIIAKIWLLLDKNISCAHLEEKDVNHIEPTFDQIEVRKA